MKLETITVEKNMLRFCLDEAFSGPVTLREETPVVHGTPRLVAQEELAFTGGAAACARFYQKRIANLVRLFFCLYHVGYQVAPGHNRNPRFPHGTFGLVFISHF